jgi:hypothetical protein
MEFDSESLVHRYIASIGTPVTSEDVDTYERLSQIEARAEGERGQRKLRLVYGTALLILLSAQIVAVTVFTFLLGFGIINVDRWVTTTFVGGTLGEVSGMTFLVVRYLFPAGRKRSKP